MKKFVFPTVFAVLFVAILLFQYNENYKFRIKPPSEEWSKEVLLGNVDGAVKTYPRILNYSEEGYLITYQNGENIKAEIIDKLGKKKHELDIPVGEEFIKYLNLLSDGENYEINWITSDKGIKTLYRVKTDKDLKIAEQIQEKDVLESAQIGDSVLVITYEDKIVLRDIKNNTSTVINVKNPGLVSGVNTNMGYLITYHEDGRYFKYFFVKDGAVSDIGLAATLSPDTKGGYFDRVSLGTDNKYAYIMVEAKTAMDRYGTIKCITFSLDGKEQSIEDFRIGSFRSLFGAVTVSSGDEARFIASGTRMYERKKSQEDIIDFAIKDGKVVKYTFASRTNELSLYPGGTDNTLLFFDYLETDKYNIYMASMDSEFKNIHDVPRNSEKNRALIDTMLGFIYSILYIFLIGLQWVLSGLTSISVVSYFAHGMKIKSKKILYIISYGILAAVKAATMYAKRGEFPAAINSSIFIIGSCIFISLLCLSYGYRKYVKDLDALPLWSYVQAMLIDTILTQMIFIPYIY